MFGRYNKFAVAVFAAVVAILTALISGASALQVALVAVTTLGGSLGVRQVANVS